MQTLKSLIKLLEEIEYENDGDLELAVEVGFEKRLGRLYVSLGEGSDADLSSIADELQSRALKSATFRMRNQPVP